MDLPDLIALLSRPEAYPHPVTAVEVRRIIEETSTPEGPMQLKVIHPRAAVNAARASIGGERG